MNETHIFTKNMIPALFHSHVASYVRETDEYFKDKPKANDKFKGARCFPSDQLWIVLNLSYIEVAAHSFYLH